MKIFILFCASFVIGVLHGSEPALPDGLAMWLRADVGLETNAAGLALRWVDQSGKGNHAEMVSEDSAPALIAEALNGKAAVQFDGVNDFLRADPHAGFFFTNGVTIFAVAQFDDIGSAQQIFRKGSGAVASPFDFYAEADTTVFKVGNGATEAAVSAKAVITSCEPHVLGAAADRDGMAVYVDSVLKGSAAAMAIEDSDDYLFLGGSPDAQRNFAGNVAEVLIFDRMLSAQEMAVVNVYLAQKYFTSAISAVRHHSRYWTEGGILSGSRRGNAVFSVSVAQGAARVGGFHRDSGCDQRGVCDPKDHDPRQRDEVSGGYHRARWATPGPGGRDPYGERRCSSAVSVRSIAQL